MPIYVAPWYQLPRARVVQVSATYNIDVKDVLPLRVLQVGDIIHLILSRVVVGPTYQLWPHAAMLPYKSLTSIAQLMKKDSQNVQLAAGPLLDRLHSLHGRRLSPQVLGVQLDL